MPNFDGGPAAVAARPTGLAGTRRVTGGGGRAYEGLRVFLPIPELNQLKNINRLCLKSPRGTAESGRI